MRGHEAGSPGPLLQPPPPGRRQRYQGPVCAGVLCTSAQGLACGVQLELEWKNLFLLQESTRKIFVPIIKVEI